MEAEIVAIDGGRPGGRQGQTKRSSVSREKALEISERLRALRNSRGLKLAEVARELNISAPAYYNYENGGTSISVTTLFVIAKFYRVAPEWLYSGEGAPGNSLCNAEIVKLCVETLGFLDDIEQQMKTPPDKTARARVFAALLRHRLAGDEIDVNTARTFYELADAQTVFQSSDASTRRTTGQKRSENSEANPLKKTVGTIGQEPIAAEQKSPSQSRSRKAKFPRRLRGRTKADNTNAPQEKTNHR